MTDQSVAKVRKAAASAFLTAPKMLGICAILAVAGCGVSYTSPKVLEGEEGNPVKVVELNASSAALANRSSYTPRSLPDVFYSVAGGGSIRGAGALPPAPYVPQETRRRLDYRPLPNTTTPPYRIGVGDVLLLATRGTASTIEQLSGLLAAQNQRQGYTVRDDGSIAIPEVGTVALSGLTVEEAEDRLFQVLVENQIDPSFSLEVAEFNSKRVAIGGAVNAATLVPITLQPLTLGTALTAAGGLQIKDREFSSIRIYRDGTLYQIPVETYLAQPEIGNRVLQDGDAVFVDTTYDLDRALSFYQSQLDVITLRSSARSTALQTLSTEIGIQRERLNEQRSNFQARAALDAVDRDYVYVTGEVATQNRFPLPFNQQASLADVLYEGGGFDNTTGDPAEIYVLRGAKGGGVIAYHLNAKNAANLILATRLQMRPNDVVFIEEQPITKWGRSLQQLFPTLISTAGSAL